MTDPNPLAGLPLEYPVELVPPDLSPYRAGNEGVDYVQTFRAEEPGPHVALCAVVHGNEPCGALALDRLLREEVRPKRGTLSFFFANLDAYNAFDAERPMDSRWADEDFNRLWSDEILESSRQSLELTRARALRPFVGTIDLLLDIHSMQHVTEPLLMAGPSPKGVALAKAVGAPETIVIDEGHAAGPRLRDFAPFIDPASPKNAVLVECGQHWETGAEVWAFETAVRFLRATGATDHIYPEVSPGETSSQKVLRITKRVTIASENFAFVDEFRGMEVIPQAGTVIANDGDTPITTPHDDCVLIMPTRRTWPGQTAVRLGRFEPHDPSA
ncbi:MAG: succinylglutamate desuccinylase/aspartoacylase family protein [Pseudomonadota bacterium]